MKSIPVKILGYKRSQRYPIKRILIQVQKDLDERHPQIQIEIEEISSADEILRYTPVITFPSLMVAGKLVCIGRAPDKMEILAWIEKEAQILT